MTRPLKNRRIEPRDDMPGEEWRDILGYEGRYLISNMGRVYSLPRVAHDVDTGKQRQIGGRFLKPKKLVRGAVDLLKDGTPCSFFLYLLVWHAFHGDLPDECVVDFRDGDPRNCAASNLCLKLRERRRFDRTKYRRMLGSLKGAGL